MCVVSVVCVCGGVVWRVCVCVSGQLPQVSVAVTIAVWVPCRLSPHCPAADKPRLCSLSPPYRLVSLMEDKPQTPWAQGHFPRGEGAAAIERACRPLRVHSGPRGPHGR